VPLDTVGPPETFRSCVDFFPMSGQAIDLACGRGRASVWLAARGLEVRAWDVSPVAVDLARDLARRAGLAHRCRFDVFDLDRGVPAGPEVDLVLCHLFWDPRLRDDIVGRMAPGGLLAIAVLSEVGVGPGRFRARPGELLGAFAGLEVLAEGEQAGRAWLLARSAASPAPGPVRRSSRSPRRPPGPGPGQREAVRDAPS
jgi:SAM-dependent methyltransferase